MLPYYGCFIPEDLYYHSEHDCWIRFENDDTAVMGMTDIAQTLAGKLLHIRFKRVGRRIKAGRSAATIESAKWVGPFVVPFDVELLETNEHTFAQDILIANKDPFEAGWLVKVRILHPEKARASLLTGKEAVAFFQEKIDADEIRCFRCVD